MKNLWGRGQDKIQAALERLDRLTKDEGLTAVAQTLGVVHGIADDTNEINKMKRLLFSSPFVAETDSIL
jgi:hypothetical protein